MESGPTLSRQLLTDQQISRHPHATVDRGGIDLFVAANLLD
jgi:hypothetical protein